MKQISIDDKKNLKFPDLFDKGNRHLLKAEIEKVLNSKTVKDSRKTNPITRRECHKITPITSRKCDSLSVKVYTLQRYLTLFNLRDFYLIKALECKECIKMTDSSETWNQIEENFIEKYPSFADSIINNTEDFAKEYIPAFLDFLDTIKNNKVYLEDIKQANNPIHTIIDKHLNTLNKSCFSLENEKYLFVVLSFLHFFTKCPLISAKIKVTEFDFCRIITNLKNINQGFITNKLNEEVFDDKQIGFVQAYTKTLLALHGKEIINNKEFSEFFPRDRVDRILIACSDPEKILFEKILKILKNTPQKHLLFINIADSCLTLTEQISRFLEQITLLAQSIGQKNVKQKVNGFISNNLNLCPNFIFHELICRFEKIYLSLSVPRKEMQKRDLLQESGVLKIVLQGYSKLLEILELEGPFDKYLAIQFFTKIKEHIQELSSKIEDTASLNSPAFLSLPSLFLMYLSVIKHLSDSNIINSEDERKLNACG